MNKHIKHYQTIRDEFVLRDNNIEVPQDKEEDIFNDDENSFDTEMDNENE
jgi:hypothetical protein